MPLSRIDPLGNDPIIVNLNFHSDLFPDFPVNGGAFAFSNQSISRKLSFISYFRGKFWKEISSAAKSYCIPPELQFSNIIAELSDYDWKDMTEFGNSVGVGQVSYAMVDLYSLEYSPILGAPESDREYMADPSISIALTAQRIDKQIIELCYAASGGRPGPHPSIPAFADIPAMAPSFQSFTASFTDIPGDLRLYNPQACRETESYSCRFDGNSPACSRPSRCSDPSATYSLLSCSGDSVNSARQSGANLARVLTTMNDVARLSPDTPPFYRRPGFGGKSHSMMIYTFIMKYGMGPFK